MVGGGSHVTTNQTSFKTCSLYTTSGWLAFDSKAFLLLLSWSDVAFTFGFSQCKQTFTSVPPDHPFTLDEGHAEGQVSGSER